MDGSIIIGRHAELVQTNSRSVDVTACICVSVPARIQYKRLPFFLYFCFFIIFVFYLVLFPISFIANRSSAHPCPSFALNCKRQDALRGAHYSGAAGSVNNRSRLKRCPGDETMRNTRLWPMRNPRDKNLQQLRSDVARSPRIRFNTVKKGEKK